MALIFITILLAAVEKKHAVTPVPDSLPFFAVVA